MDKELSDTNQSANDTQSGLAENAGAQTNGAESVEKPIKLSFLKKIIQIIQSLLAKLKSLNFGKKKTAKTKTVQSAKTAVLTPGEPAQPTGEDKGFQFKFKTDKKEEEEPPKEETGKNADSKLQSIKNLIFGKLGLNKLAGSKAAKTDGDETAKKSKFQDSKIGQFINKYKIPLPFMISALLCLASIGLYFVLVAPLQSKNAKLTADIIKKAAEFDKYYRKGKKINSQKWIDAKINEIENGKNEQQACNDIFAGKDDAIEMVFRDEEGNEIKDAALWKNRHAEETAVLISDLNSNGFETEKAGYFKKWHKTLPTEDEIKTEQKRFWIQREFINIIKKNRKFIRKINTLKLRKKTDLDVSPLADIFNPAPFIFSVEMMPSKLLYLIRDIINSKLSFYIESINIQSYNSSSKSGINKPDNFSVVTIKGYAIDFIIKKENDSK